MSATPISKPVADLISRLLTARTQADMLAMLKSEPKVPSSKAIKTEVKATRAALEIHLREGRSREAIATALAMTFFDVDHALSSMRRDGLLRSSKYDYNGALIARVAKVLLTRARAQHASPERITYLESIIALTKLAGNAQSLYAEIVRTVRTHRTVVLKTLFVVVNSLLFQGWFNDPDRHSLDAGRYSSEEYAEATSMIMAIYATQFPIDDATFNYVDPKALAEHAALYQRLLVAAIRLIKFREAETFIDGLPYRADLDGETVTISSIDPDIERSIRLGYIQSLGQAMLRVQHLRHNTPALSMRDFVRKGFEKGALQKLTQIAETPYRRLRLMIPGIPQIFSIFSGDELFREEVEAMALLDADNFGEWDDLTFNITAKVSTLDLFKVQRFFNFLSCLYQERLLQIEDEAERAELILSSTILVVSHDSLLEQLQLIFPDQEKCGEIIALLTMKPNEGHLDLQYRPFVNLGSYYAIAPHVVAISNIVRNTVLSNRLREAEIGDRDRMIDAVRGALSEAGFLVETDYEVKLGGRALELDVVAYKDGALFLFEGKNAYHPCSTHEMRNSWDHLKTARDQLNIRQALLTDANHQRSLYAKLGWKVAPGSVHTSIILSNRVFHGARLHGHPVRQAHELINVLTSGSIVGPEDSLRFWRGEAFEVQDMIEYLGPGSVAAAQLAALERRDWVFAMGYRTLTFASYVLDPLKLQELMQERYGPSIPGGHGILAGPPPGEAGSTPDLP